MKIQPRKCKAYLACILVLLLSACTGSAHQLPQVSQAEMRAIQKEYEGKNKNLTVFNRSDAANRALVQRASRRLQANAKPLCDYTGYKRCYFQTIYVPDGTVNAYASEGYKITMHRGLMRYLANEEEVAAVVAHEMGHHMANHNEEKIRNAATGAAIAGILTAVVIAAANQNNPNYTVYQQQRDQDTVRNMTIAGAHMGALSYSKEEEREADLLGGYLLARSKYDMRKAERMLGVTIRMSDNPDIGKSAWGDSHPSGYERIASWRKTAAEIKTSKTKMPLRKVGSSLKPVQQE